MKKLLFIIFFSILFTRIFSQINLVPNYSFETLISCPQVQGGSFYSYAPPWFSPNINTPDIYNTCASINDGGVPYNWLGYQLARTGNGYGGFARNSINGEFLSIKLNSPLQTGNKYCVSFFVSPGNYTYYVIDGIGAYLSSDSIHISNYNILPFIPQIENPSGNIISDTVNWTEISGVYTAIGGEQYINIGSFSPDSILQIAYNDTINPPGAWPYYFLDDVSVYLCDDKVNAEAGNNQIMCKGDSVQIGTNPKSEYSYSWQPTTGISNAFVANPIVSPIVTTTYIIQQTDFMNEITYDSVTVTVQSCEDSIKDDIFIPNIFSPNGDLNNDVFYVLSHTIAEMTFCIYNRWGEKVFESREINKGWDGTYKNEKCNTGVFVYYLDATLIDGRKVGRQGNVTLVR